MKSLKYYEDKINEWCDEAFDVLFLTILFGLMFLSTYGMIILAIIDLIFFPNFDLTQLFIDFLKGLVF